MVGHGVAVQDPVDAPVDDDDIWILVELQEGCQRIDPVGHIAIEEHLRLRAELRADQHVHVAETDRKGEAAKRRRQRDAGFAFPLGVLLGLPQGVVNLGLLRVRQHVAGGMAADVDAGLGDGWHAGRGNVLQRQHRVALGRRLVGSGGDHAVAVRVLEFLVDPARV